MKKQSASWVQQKKLLICNEIVKTIYKQVNGIQISSDYRNQLVSQGLENDKSLTYGEIIPQSFLQILSLVQSSLHRSSLSMPLEFVDLGCGTGKAIFCAAFSGLEFSRCWGIEIVPGLVRKADEAKATFAEAIQSSKSMDNITVGKKVLTLDEIISRNKLPYTGNQDNSNLFIEKIQSAITAAGQSIPVEQLTNILCKELGHKVYRTALKTHGKFTSFLSAAKDTNGKMLFKIDESGFVSAHIDTPVPPPPSSSDVDFAPLKDDNELILVESQEEIIDKQHDTTYLTNIFRSMEFQSCYSSIPEIIFTEGDIFSIEWWDRPRVIYVASLLFSEPMMTQLTECILRAPACTWIITLKPLIVPQESIEIVVLKHESFFRMSWQMAKVYIYEKVI